MLSRSIEDAWKINELATSEDLTCYYINQNYDQFRSWICHQERVHAVLLSLHLLLKYHYTCCGSHVVPTDKKNAVNHGVLLSKCLDAKSRDTIERKLPEAST